MIASLLIPLVLGGTIPEPVDPDLEVRVVESTFDAEAVCPEINRIVLYLAVLTGEPDLVAELVVAWSVERYEEGYGRNLTEPGEDALIALFEACDAP